ncbi:MAG TPA: biotin/lipoyl-containing protein, partial [Trebonia sp.]|nr:biotin/lipoyl-containing protein [Trebonia sp.]
KILDAAAKSGANAIHPGYGFLSENAGFARACADAGLIFVGPPADAIAAMGSKTRAKDLMRQAGVPVLPSVTVSDDSADVSGTPLTFPVLVKAAFGGGGRGMRVVSDPADLDEAVAGARREAAAAFGDGTVFLESLVEPSRHIEVQIFADNHGNVVHLFERECSIQRRYQKIIEEAPSPAVSDALRTDLGNAAVLAAKAIGYSGAGTVEFIMDRHGNFFFLEMNTRLQVEHPVTEAVTSLDLVALQLAVAEGKPLPPEVLDAGISGHAIEARLYAEDPANGYLPATGTLATFEIPDLPDSHGQPRIRVDSGVTIGSEVSVHYDPLLAKVIAHAPTREDAARLLARALSRARVHGVVTNRDLLIGILREDEFLSGRIDTGYLDRHSPAELAAPPSPGTGPGAPGRTVLDRTVLDKDLIHAIAVALADQALRRADAPVLRGVPSGWRNVPSAPQRVSYTLTGRDGVGRGDAGPDGAPDGGDRTIEVTYRIRRDGASSGGTAEVTVDGGVPFPVVLRETRPDLADLEIGGVRRRVAVVRDTGTRAATRYADSGLGATTLTEVDRLPESTRGVRRAGSLTAPMPGTVVRVEAAPGDVVTAGQVLIVLEAMKMEHSVRAPRDGTVGDVRVSAGQAVDQGAVLAVLVSDDEPRGHEPRGDEPRGDEPRGDEPGGGSRGDGQSEEVT